VPALSEAARAVEPSASFSIFASDLDIAKLFEGSLIVVILSFFGFGMLLAFTPCVLPMVPILSGIIAGEGRKLNKARAFLLSVSYVLGMAVTYAIAGVAAAYSGTLLAAALQNAWVLGAFALLLTEELLKFLLELVSKDWVEYWRILMGPLLVLSVIFFRRGLAGIFAKPDA